MGENRFLLFFDFPPWGKVDFRCFLVFPRGGKPFFAVFWFSPVRESWFSPFSCFPPWGKDDFRWFLIFPREGKMIFADFLFSPVRESWFLLVFVHRTPTPSSFQRFLRFVGRRWAVFMFLCSSLPGTGLFLLFYVRWKFQQGQFLCFQTLCRTFRSAQTVVHWLYRYSCFQ